MSRSYIPKALRRRVEQAAQKRCGYCLTAENVIGTPMEIDHLRPEALDGPTIESNLWLACSLCNTFKGCSIEAADLLSGQTVRLFNPRTDLWSEHFFGSASGLSAD